MLLSRRSGALAMAARGLRSMATKGNPKNPGEGSGFFGLYPAPAQTDSQKFDTFHAGHKVVSVLTKDNARDPELLYTCIAICAQARVNE